MGRLIGAAAFALAAALSLSGCVGTMATSYETATSTTSQSADEVEAVREVVENAFDLKAAVAEDGSELAATEEFSELSDIGVNPEKLFEAVFDKYSYTIDKIVVEGRKAYATVTTSTVDYAKVAESLNEDPSAREAVQGFLTGTLDDAETARDLMNDLIEALMAPDAPMVERVGTVELVKPNAKWVFTSDDEVYDLVSAAG